MAFLPTQPKLKIEIIHRPWEIKEHTYADSLAKIQVCVTFHMNETLSPSNLRSGVFVWLVFLKT